MSIKSKARMFSRKIRRMKTGLTFAECCKLGKFIAQGMFDSSKIKSKIASFHTVELFADGCPELVTSKGFTLYEILGNL
jgi:hypothetical protein